MQAFSITSLTNNDASYDLPPKPKNEQVEVSAKPDTTEYVEVLRGLNKDKVPLSR